MFGEMFDLDAVSGRHLRAVAVDQEFHLVRVSTWPAGSDASPVKLACLRHRCHTTRFPFFNVNTAFSPHTSHLPFFTPFLSWHARARAEAVVKGPDPKRAFPEGSSLSGDGLVERVNRRGV